MNNVKEHFDLVAKDYDYYKKKNWFYYKNLKALLHSLIPVNKDVFEVGCGTGDLLSELSPVRGYGMDLSSKMIKIAKAKHRKNLKLTFSTIFPKKKYDYIFMSDVIEHLENPNQVINKISNLMTNKTVFINTMANPLWEPVLLLAEKLKLKMPEGPHYRLSGKEFEKLLKKSGLKVVKHDYALLIPISIPMITYFTNKYLEKYFKKYAFIEYFVASKV